MICRHFCHTHARESYFMRMLVKQLTRTESNMLQFCARGGPHAHVRVKRCTSTNTLHKSASRARLGAYDTPLEPYG